MKELVAHDGVVHLRLKDKEEALLPTRRNKTTQARVKYKANSWVIVLLVSALSLALAACRKLMFVRSLSHGTNSEMSAVSALYLHFRFVFFPAPSPYACVLVSLASASPTSAIPDAVTFRWVAMKPTEGASHAT